MFISAARLYDPHAERRGIAARQRTALALIRARRLRRWAERSARLAAVLARHASARHATARHATARHARVA